MKRATRTALFIIGLAVIAGCVVGPEYRRPAPLSSQPLPAAFTTNGVTWKSASPSADLPRGAWWKIFADSDLDRLQELAAAQNQTVASNIATFNVARALVNVARSGFFPQISADPSYNRQRTSWNAPLNGKPARAAYTYNTFELPLELNWEADIWGRVRNRTEGARSRLAAAADDVAAVKLLVQTEVAQDYFTLRTQDAELKLLADTVETYRLSLDLTENRRKGGIATDLDVSQAETQLRTTEAGIPALRLQRAKLLHALATLCGQPAMIFEISAPVRNLPPDMRFPSILPSELLERRPDIAAAERRVKAANADIGVAQSAYYPSITFNGLAGMESVNAGSLLSGASRLWSFGPNVNLPIFTGGLNRAQLEAARSAYDTIVAVYRQTVLAAFQDVEDQLAAQDFLAAQLQGENAALVSARRTLEIANNRYAAGLVTYLEVATAQSAELDLDRAVVQLEGARRVAAVALIKALGGGWERKG